MGREAVEIGRHLTDVRIRLRRDAALLGWAKESLGWSERSVYNFIALFNAVTTGKLANSADFNIDVSACFGFCLRSRALSLDSASAILT
jgi:hypothetical protein